MIITTCKSWCILAAAAAAKLLQSCPTLCDPIDGSPPGSPVPGILQARTLEWVAISFSNAWKWKVNSYRVVIISSSWLIETKWIWKIPWKEGMATHSVLLPGQRSLAGYSPCSCRVKHDWATNSISLYICTICLYVGMKFGFMICFYYCCCCICFLLFNSMFY